MWTWFHFSSIMSRHPSSCVPARACGDYAIALQYDVLLMTECAAGGRTAEGNGRWGLSEEVKGGTGRPDPLEVLSVCILQS